MTRPCPFQCVVFALAGGREASLPSSEAEAAGVDSEGAVEGVIDGEGTVLSAGLVIAIGMAICTCTCAQICDAFLCLYTFAMVRLWMAE